MNQWVAEMFGTNGAGASDTQTVEDGQTKTAQLELFAKMAAEEGIDLGALSPEQVDALFNHTFSKSAQEEEEEGEGKDEGKKAPPPFPPKKEGNGEEEDKEAAAIREHEEKKAQVAKFAEAELMGQVMAHSLVRELGDIEKEATAKGIELPAALALITKSASKNGATSGPQPTSKTAAPAQNQASALDQLAAEKAVKMAAAAEYDEGEARARVGAILTLGLKESEKVAHIESTADAIHVRALEFLENAGYPVNWDEVFGGK